MLDKIYLLSNEAKRRLESPSSFSTSLEEQGMQAVFGFSDRAIRGFYEAAKQLLEQKRYAEAADAFLFLTYIAPHIKTFWLARARSERLNYSADQAIALYVVALSFDEADEQIYMECVRCCLEAGRKDEAVQILDMALRYCQKHSSYALQNFQERVVSCKKFLLN